MAAQLVLARVEYLEKLHVNNFDAKGRSWQGILDGSLHSAVVQVTLVHS